MSIRDPEDPRHGSYRGYKAHRRIKDDVVCEACVHARREYNNARYNVNRPEVACQVCGTRCRSKYEICSTCRISLPVESREPVRCTECGTYTITCGDLCNYCKGYGAGTLRDADLLLDGWWVRDGLTLRWVALATVEDYRRRAGERVA